MQKHVAVLMGGLSEERQISLESGAACAAALAKKKYCVTRVDVGYDVSNVLQKLKPDVAFNVLHGSYGEDGFIQGILEYLRIPYTHSGVLASALASHKALAKQLVAQAGVAVADSVCVERCSLSEIDVIPRPYIIKPAIGGGSSLGVFLITENDEIPAALLAKDWIYGDEVLVEKYIAGREFTCAVMDGKSLGVCEISGVKGIYDFTAKYSEGDVKHDCYVKSLPNLYQKIETMAVLAHKTLGCRGITRSDFRYNEATGELVWLELNTQPGMTEVSLVPDMAKAVGIPFEDLVAWLVEDASCMR